MSIESYTDFYGTKTKRIVKKIGNMELTLVVTTAFNTVTITKKSIVNGVKKTAVYTCEFSQGIKNFDFMIKKYGAIL
jgi:hypothetical protein